MKKKKTPQPEMDLIPGQTSRDVLIGAMQRLSNNEDYKLLRRRWVYLRSEILRHGKSKPSEGQWHKLDGFDVCCTEADFWTQRKIGTKDLQDRQNDLMAAIRGGKQ